MALAVVAVGLAATVSAPARADGTADRFWPVSGAVVRLFDPPDQPWLGGHRGIDIAAPAGATVVAAATGVVSWVGTIDGVPMLTVTHADGLRTTYQPVRATVARGAAVGGGEAVGVLQTGHAASPCLHLGLLRGDDYLDPLAWLSAGLRFAPIRLLPNDTVLSPPGGNQPGLFVPATSGWPVSGRVSSPYGWRTDPFTGAQHFHDGTDIAAPCGTPIVATISGTVFTVATNSILGHYLVVTHANGLRTIYGHLSEQLVRAGQSVAVGQVLGLVGTTGRSTGCHLHFGATRNGAVIDSGTLLG